MPQNTIDFPDDLYAGLRAAAAANRRTIKAEVLTMVEQAVRWRRIRDGRPEGTEPTRLALHDDITQCPRPVDVTRAADRGPYGAGQRLICCCWPPVDDPATVNAQRYNAYELLTYHGVTMPAEAIGELTLDDFREILHILNIRCGGSGSSAPTPDAARLAVNKIIRIHEIQSTPPHAFAKLDRIAGGDPGRYLEVIAEAVGETLARRERDCSGGHLAPVDDGCTHCGGATDGEAAA